MDFDESFDVLVILWLISRLRDRGRLLCGNSLTLIELCLLLFLCFLASLDDDNHLEKTFFFFKSGSFFQITALRITLTYKPVSGVAYFLFFYVVIG